MKTDPAILAERAEIRALKADLIRACPYETCWCGQRGGHEGWDDCLDREVQRIRSTPGDDR